MTIEVKRKKRVQKLVRGTFGDALSAEARQELYRAFLSNLSKNNKKSILEESPKLDLP